MKIYMNKPRSHWLSPYKILEKVLFWEDNDEIYGLAKHPKQNGQFVSWDVFKDLTEDRHQYTKPYIAFLLKVLEYPCDWLMKVLDKVHPKIDYVKIDRWDTWSMDCTLAPIILPMLKQLKDTKHGVPAEFIHGNDGVSEIPFEIAEKKWNNVLDQMIWSFEQILEEDTDAPFFVKGNYDREGHMKHRRKIQRGLDLFGRHYLSLWD